MARNKAINWRIWNVFHQTMFDSGRYVGTVKASSKSAAKRAAVRQYPLTAKEKEDFGHIYVEATTIQANSGRISPSPVRVSATVTGSGTGWIKARAVRIVTKRGVSRVEVKR